MVILSGLLCAPNEPIADIPAKIYHFGPGSWHLYTGFGRPIALWVLTAYIMFFGGLTAVIVMLLRKGARYQQLWLAALGVWVVNLMIEIPLTGNHGVYKYYGYQPFSIGNFAVMQLVLNCAGVILAAGIIAKASRSFQGVRVLLIAPVVPASQIASLAIGLPGYWLLNSSISFAWQWVGVGTSLVIGVFVIDGMLRFLTGQPQLGMAIAQEAVAATSVAPRPLAEALRV